MLSDHALPEETGPYILVSSTTEAMKKIAAFYRKQLSCKVVGITGSVGKTSTKEMLKTALEEPEKLREIGYLLRMITKEDIVPGEFRELYDTFRKTLRLK